MPRERVFTVKDEIPTEIVCILDRSGSMGSICNDAIGGFNSFLKEQKELPGKATFTLILFDHEYEVKCNGIDIKEVTPLNNRTYVPRGSTALYDAIGRAICNAESRIDKCNPKKSRVLVSILTDGEENSSKEYDKCKILSMIQKCRDKYGWEFIYLSASPSAFSDAEKIGIRVGRVMQFSHTGSGIRGMTASYGCSASSYRSTGQMKDFTPNVKYK